MIKPSVCNAVVGSNGNEYCSIRELARELGISKSTISKSIKKNGSYRKNGITYQVKGAQNDAVKPNGKSKMEETFGENVIKENEEEFKEYLEAKKAVSQPFENYHFKFKEKELGYKYAVALFSDAHIEETVKPSSVLGKNEYNIDIARERIENYFVNLVNCLNADEADYLIFASLGDTISGYIHEELAQCNSMTPLEATVEAQNLIYSGLCYICENIKTVKKIEFIGIVGNHSRTTKKIQHANGYKQSYEWIMYQNIMNQCKAKGLDINFNIPESEMAVVTAPDGRVFMFMHGYQVKSGGNGTVCGIYPALNRLSMKLAKVFHQNKIYIGHFHSCVSIPNAVVNGSIIGYNAFALSNAFECEEPAQMYELYDSNMGLMVTRLIYCK